MGRLLHDKTFINKIPVYSTVAGLVRMEVLGRFINECINWLEHTEREEKEGLISDDRFAEGVQNVSLISFVIGSIAVFVFVYVYACIYYSCAGSSAHLLNTKSSMLLPTPTQPR